MQQNCPKCGARNIGWSAPRGSVERIVSFFGFFKMRCKVCATRFATSVWERQTWRYSRCPKCLRFDLRTWNIQNYRPPTSTTVLLRLGARPHRCDVCRCNFASFRSRKVGSRDPIAL
jgi:hypothetical protein